MKTEKNMMSRLFGLNKATKIGMYTVVISAILLAVLIVVNLLVGAIPTSFTKLDTSANKLYSLSATSKKFVSAINEDVTIWVLCRNGEPDSVLEVFLERYTGLNGHVTVKTADPVKDPSFLEKFNGASSLSYNSMIVESAKRWTMIESANLSYYHIAGAGDLDAATYNNLISNDYYVQYYAAYGIDLKAAVPYFAGEQAVTSAIEYVTLETIPHLYVLTGNGEETLGTAVAALLEKVAMTYETLNLTTAGGVPEDASAVLINAPANDISATETAALRTFMQAGGDLVVLTAPGCETMPNLMGLLNEWGLSTAGATVYEGNANKYKDTPNVLIPSVNTSHDITASLVQYGTAMVMPQTHGINVAETLPEGVSVTALFATSDAAYVKNADGSEQDIGTTPLAVVAENGTTGGKLVWFGSAAAFDDAAIASYGQGAGYYLVMAFSWTNQSYASSLSAIEAVDMSANTLTVPSLSVLIWAIVLILAIPAALIVAGIVIWARRRRR